MNTYVVLIAYEYNRLSTTYLANCPYRYITN